MKRFYFLTLIFSFILADTLSMPISEFAIIQGKIGNRMVSRLLIRFDLSGLLGKKVYYGEIKIPNFLQEGELTFEGWRMITEWNRNNVNWNSFRRPGGDYDTTDKAHFKIEAFGWNPIILDITRFLRYWLERGENYGLLLKRPYYENDGFGVEMERLRGVMERVRLKVYYAGGER